MEAWRYAYQADQMAYHKNNTHWGTYERWYKDQARAVANQEVEHKKVARASKYPRPPSGDPRSEDDEEESGASTPATEPADDADRTSLGELQKRAARILGPKAGDVSQDRSAEESNDLSTVESDSAESESAESESGSMKPMQPEKEKSEDKKGTKVKEKEEEESEGEKCSKVKPGRERRNEKRGAEAEPAKAKPIAPKTKTERAAKQLLAREMQSEPKAKPIAPKAKKEKATQQLSARAEMERRAIPVAVAMGVARNQQLLAMNEHQVRSWLRDSQLNSLVAHEFHEGVVFCMRGPILRYIVYIYIYKCVPLEPSRVRRRDHHWMRRHTKATASYQHAL